MKHSLDKIIDPDLGKVHFRAPYGLDQVTMCGITDWLEGPDGVETDEPVTCWACKRMVGHIHSHRKPRGADKW